MKRTPVAEAGVGDIVAMAGFKDINIGETVADAANPEALPSIHIDEPTLSMVSMSIRVLSREEKAILLHPATSAPA